MALRLCPDERRGGLFLRRYAVCGLCCASAGWGKERKGLSTLLRRCTSRRLLAHLSHRPRPRHTYLCMYVPVIWRQPADPLRPLSHPIPLALLRSPALAFACACVQELAASYWQAGNGALFLDLVQGLTGMYE